MQSDHLGSGGLQTEAGVSSEEVLGLIEEWLLEAEEYQQ